MTVVIGCVRLRISIGRNIVDGELQIVEDHLIDFCRICLGNILLSSNRQQGDVAEHANQIKIQNGAQCMAFAHIGAFQRLILPLYLWLVFDKFITTVDTLIITCPVCFVKIKV